MQKPVNYYQSAPPSWSCRLVSSAVSSSSCIVLCSKHLFIDLRCSQVPSSLLLLCLIKTTSSSHWTDNRLLNQSNKTFTVSFLAFSTLILLSLTLFILLLISCSKLSCLHPPPSLLCSPSFYLINFAHEQKVSGQKFSVHSRLQGRNTAPQSVLRWAFPHLLRKAAGGLGPMWKAFSQLVFLQVMTLEKKHIHVGHPTVSLFTYVLQWELVWSQNPVVGWTPMRLL